MTYVGKVGKLVLVFFIYLHVIHMKLVLINLKHILVCVIVFKKQQTDILNSTEFFCMITRLQNVFESLAVIAGQQYGQ
jgi:hypothetical protein